MHSPHSSHKRVPPSPATAPSAGGASGALVPPPHATNNITINTRARRTSSRWQEWIPSSILLADLNVSSSARSARLIWALCSAAPRDRLLPALHPSSCRRRSPVWTAYRVEGVGRHRTSIRRESLYSQQL